MADTGQFQLEELSKRQNCSIVCINLNWPILVLFLACGENRGKPSRVPAAFSVNLSIFSKLQNIHYMWLTHVSVSGEPGKCVSVCSSTHTHTDPSQPLTVERWEPDTLLSLLSWYPWRALCQTWSAADPRRPSIWAELLLELRPGSATSLLIFPHLFLWSEVQTVITQCMNSSM